MSGRPGPSGPQEPPRLTVEVEPRWPFRLPARGGMDGVMRAAPGALLRFLHVEAEPVVVEVRQPQARRVVLRAWAADRAAAAYGIERLRFALGVDDDLRDFHERFRHDPLIGRALRAHPELRVRRRPEPFEALAWAITEQLIEYTRAAAIQRRIVRAIGPRCPTTGLRDVPDAAALAGAAPAWLESCDLAASRAISLVRAAREVARGRIDLHAGDHERAWRRLRAIPGIGRWTIEMLALNGQGRLDIAPAGDLGFIKVVGRLLTGDPRARAEEDDVRALLSRYDPYAGIAGAYLLRMAVAGRIAPGAVVAPGSVTAPGRAGTRSSPRRPRRAAA